METAAEREPKRGTVLVVDDEPTIARHVEQLLSTVFDVHTAHSVRDAIDIVAQSTELSGAVIDVGLPDGSGLDIATQIRERYEYIPMMILTGTHEPSVINRVHTLGAGYVAKPDYDDNLSRFLREVLVDPERSQKQLSAAVEDFVTQHSLSPRESQILVLAIGGVPRARIAEVLGVSENTIKTQVRSLLDKCDETSLADVVWRVRSSIRHDPLLATARSQSR